MRTTFVELAGRYMAIAIAGASPFVQMDSSDASSVVYCRARQVVASWPSLIPYDADTGDDREYIDAIGVLYENAMDPVSMTPRLRQLRALDTSHPSGGPTFPSEDVRAILDLFYLE